MCFFFHRVSVVRMRETVYLLSEYTNDNWQIICCCFYYCYRVYVCLRTRTLTHVYIRMNIITKMYGQISFQSIFFVVAVSFNTQKHEHNTYTFVQTRTLTRSLISMWNHQAISIVDFINFSTERHAHSNARITYFEIHTCMQAWCVHQNRFTSIPDSFFLFIFFFLHSTHTSVCPLSNYIFKFLCIVPAPWTVYSVGCMQTRKHKQFLEWSTSTTLLYNLKRIKLQVYDMLTSFNI